MPEIRLASFDDLPGILAISNWAARHTAANFAVEPETLESWQQDWHDTHERYPWFVAADEDDRVIGFAKASPWKGRCAYEWTAETTVYVHPDHHGGGIGKTLYEKLLATCKAQGYHTLLGGITVPNPASVRLHEAIGFRRVALLEKVGWKFGTWHDVGYWEAVLEEERSAPESIKPVKEVMDLRAAHPPS